MQTLIALLVAAAAACAVARPGATTAPEPLPAAQGHAYEPDHADLADHEDHADHAYPPDPAYAPDSPAADRDRLMDYVLPRLMLARFLANFGLENRVSPLYTPQMGELTKEINRLRMEDEENNINPYDENNEDEVIDPEEAYVETVDELPVFIDPSVPIYDVDLPCAEEQQPEQEPTPQAKYEIKAELYLPPIISYNKSGSTEKQKEFAYTPLDKEYYHEPYPLEVKVAFTMKDDAGLHEEKVDEPIAAMLIEPPRQTRQNPINLSKQKHLLEPDLAKLKTGLANKDYRMPVSLLPSNLRWLKIYHPEKHDHDFDERSHEEGEQPKTHQIHSLEAPTDPADSIYGVALVAAVGAALAMAILGFAFGWYTLSKKAKAAADVDYPAYGVTGPAVDTSGDRKLAHSAHMYHYQHQKQQIIAMERNGMDQRPNSVSDPESEEDNEEGDYTVYECPGFATTGDMEVKNPLFSEEPTPVTPGKCEVVKPQPKD